MNDPWGGGKGVILFPIRWRTHDSQHSLGEDVSTISRGTHRREEHKPRKRSRMAESTETKKIPPTGVLSLCGDIDIIDKKKSQEKEER